MNAGVRPRESCAALALAALALACAIHRSEAPAGLGLAVPVQLEPLRAWRVVDAAATVGFVVEFRETGAAAGGARHYFSVRNPWQQELGSIDSLGRAWRFEVHAASPRWIGTGTVRDGAREILGASAEAQLEAVPVERLAAPRVSHARQSLPVPASAPPGARTAVCLNPIGAGRRKARAASHPAPTTTSSPRAS
jgi:hypothetical protein